MVNIGSILIHTLNRWLKVSPTVIGKLEIDCKSIIEQTIAMLQKSIFCCINNELNTLLLIKNHGLISDACSLHTLKELNICCFIDL